MKKIRLKNDVDKGLMSAIIYVAGKTCCEVLYLSHEERETPRKRSRMTGHSDSNFDRSLEAPGDSYSIRFGFSFTDIWTTQREIERVVIRTINNHKPEYEKNKYLKEENERIYLKTSKFYYLIFIEKDEFLDTVFKL